MALLPLEGYAVGITADRRWEEQAELLRRRGAEILHGPTIITRYLGGDDDLRRASASLLLAPPDYLVATTGLGMRSWLEAARSGGGADQLRLALAGARVVARGPKAAAAVQAAGLDVWRRPSTERMPEVLDLLAAEPLAGRHVAVQEYGERTPGLAAALRARGAVVTEVAVYRWELPDDDGPARRLLQAACTQRLAAITFTSAPAVHNLFRMARRHGARHELLRAFHNGLVAACVGPVCARGARAEGVPAPLEPPVGRLGLMVRALCEHLEPRRRTLRLAGAEVVSQGSVVVVDGEPVALAPLEQAVFRQLVARPGAVVPRTRLLRDAWGSAHADPHLLEATIARLRRRLGPCGAALLPARGRGYRLDAETPTGGEEPGTAP